MVHPKDRAWLARAEKQEDHQGLATGLATGAGEFTTRHPMHGWPYYVSWVPFQSHVPEAVSWFQPRSPCIDRNCRWHRGLGTCESFTVISHGNERPWLPFGFSLNTVRKGDCYANLNNSSQCDNSISHFKLTYCHPDASSGPLDILVSTTQCFLVWLPLDIDKRKPATFQKPLFPSHILCLFLHQTQLVSG